MKRIKIGFQGERGAFSELALQNFLSDKAEPVPFISFLEIFENLKKRKIDCAIIPIENSLFGSVSENYDYLGKYSVKIIAEVNQKIEHCLLGTLNSSLKDIKEIISHPQALGQCSNFLRKIKGVEIKPFYDTAGAAKYVSEKNDPSIAAIASVQAAKVYNLKVLKRSLQNNDNNYTRFFLITNKNSKINVDQRLNSKEKKVSIFFELDNKPGALFRALSIFALRDINLSKIESRPAQGEVFNYNFFLDFIGSLKEKRCVNALLNLQEISKKVKILGEYFAGITYDE